MPKVVKNISYVMEADSSHYTPSCHNQHTTLFKNVISVIEYFKKPIYVQYINICSGFKGKITYPYSISKTVLQ